MWKTICTTNGLFMLDVKSLEEIYTLYLTDLKKIWTKEFSKECMVQKFQESNPTFDVKIDEAITQILMILNEVDKTEVYIHISDINALIKIKSDIGEFKNSDFKMKFEVELTLAKDDKFTHMITIPMLQTVYFLEKQQKMLCNLLERKDKELNEYKMEKGPISRNDLVTEKFEGDILKTSSETLILDVYGKSKEFMEKLSEQYGKIEEKVTEVVVEPWNQMKKKRKIYNSTTAAKKKARYIAYKQNN